MFERFFKKKNTRPFTSAVLAAGGSASRMGGINKVLAEVNELPVIAYSLLALQNSDHVDEIVIAASEESLLPITDICREYGIDKATKVIRGGNNRAESVYKALCECAPEAQFALVHDAARPLLTPDLVAAVCEKGYEFKCATAAVPVKDTIKVVAADGLVVETPERATLFAVQTPQVTDIELLKGALFDAARQGIEVTDDCAAVERLHIRSAIVPGYYENIKITTPEDLDVAAVLLERLEE